VNHNAVGLDDYEAVMDWKLCTLGRRTYACSL